MIQSNSVICTSFIIGPVARIEKVYNPQEKEDELDVKAKSFYFKGNGTRLLQVSSGDIGIGDSGVDFNAVAESSAFNTTISIDEVTIEARAYSNTTTTA